MADPPGKTGTPLIEDVDENSVTLSWGKPRDDGGDKVQGYVVEVREKGTNKWKPLNEKSPCRDNKYTGTCRLSLLNHLFTIVKFIVINCECDMKRILPKLRGSRKAAQC